MSEDFLKTIIESLNRFEEGEYKLIKSDGLLQIFYEDRVVFQYVETPFITELGKMEIFRMLMHHGVLRCKEMIIKTP